MRRIAIGPGIVEFVAKATNEFGNFGAATGIGIQELRGEEWVTIGGVAYADWNGVNVVAHIASDGSRQWMSKRFLWTIFDYPFNQLKVNRITCEIGSKNLNSINLCERLGFACETALQGAHPDGDLLIYRLWKRDCKWINLAFLKPLAKAA